MCDCTSGCLCALLLCCMGSLFFYNRVKGLSLFGGLNNVFSLFGGYAL